MKKLVYIGILIFSFVSCTEKTETIDLSDIIGESDRYKEGQSDSLSDTPIIDSFELVKREFVQKGIPLKSVLANSTKYFADRFNPEYAHRYRLISGQDTTEYCLWKFKDSSRVMNAFVNWLDCFGDGCKSLYFGESKNMQKQATQIFLNDTVLVYIENPSALNFKIWDEYHQNLGDNIEWNYSIEQQRRGSAKWYTFKEKEKIKYEK